MFFVVKRISQKSNKPYSALVIRVSNIERILSYDVSIICLALDISPLQLFNLDIGEYPVSERR